MLLTGRAGGVWLGRRYGCIRSYYENRVVFVVLRDAHHYSWWWVGGSFTTRNHVLMATESYWRSGNAISLLYSSQSVQYNLRLIRTLNIKLLFFVCDIFQLL